MYTLDSRLLRARLLRASCEFHTLVWVFRRSGTNGRALFWIRSYYCLFVKRFPSMPVIFCRWFFVFITLNLFYLRILMSYQHFIYVGTCWIDGRLVSLRFFVSKDAWFAWFFKISTFQGFPACEGTHINLIFRLNDICSKMCWIIFSFLLYGSLNDFRGLRKSLIIIMKSVFRESAYWTAERIS